MSAHHAYLRKIGLLPAQIRAWNSHQLELLKKGKIFIESGYKVDVQRWYLYLINDEQVNNAEKDNYFFNQLFSSNVANIKDNIDLNLKLDHSTGFIFPSEQFLFYREESFKDLLDAMDYWKYFSLHTFFRDVSKEKELSLSNILFYYWKCYYLNLNKLRSKKAWFSEIVDIPIEYCCEFSQLFVLLFQSAELHLKMVSKQVFNKSLQKSSDSIKKFFSENHEHLNGFYNNPQVDFTIKINLFKEGAKHKGKTYDAFKKIKDSDNKSFFQRILKFSKEKDQDNPINPLIPFSMYPKKAFETMNLIFNPLLEWKIIKGRHIPAWNVFKEFDIGYEYSDLKYREDRYQNEQNRLKFHSNKLNKITSIRDLKKIRQEMNDFEFEDLESKWSFSIEETIKNIEIQKRYRILRMKELGIIHNQDSEYSEKKNIWLTEMLQIESEIGPYLPFVKEAFKSALPVRKRIVYDADRTVEDGVEFDPLTVFDQDKWLRGQVMKAMRQETSLGEIEQINCFCLDFSGSMYHEKMRNLFKVLYLLVLALEDRKSYDAFHFFSNKFIKGIDYSPYHTNKKVLFQILKVISKIRFRELKYEGLDGTNMSSGIKGCIDRMMDYNNKIKESGTKKNVVYSLFVISDGRPSMGIVDLQKLNKYIEAERKKTGISIKGIYIKEYQDSPDFISEIFGKEHCVETDSFENGVHRFVKILTETYKKQRKEYRWQKKMELLNGKRNIEN